MIVEETGRGETKKENGRGDGRRGVWKEVRRVEGSGKEERKVGRKRKKGRGKEREHEMKRDQVPNGYKGPFC